MKSISFSLLLLFSAMMVSAQFPESVQVLNVPPNKVSKFQGNLSDGAKIEDLSWAASSSNACWPGTQHAKFRGNHVFHAFEIPPYSEVMVTLIPDDPNENFSLYGYQIGTTNYSVPPNLSRCVTCEADHKWDRPHRGKTQDHTRSINFNSIKNPYNIVIGVVGGDGQTSGAYTLKIDLRSRVTDNTPQEKLKIYSAKAVKGKTLAYGGNLNEGTPVRDLSFAARSSVACFPATQNPKFTGNQVFFVTEIPERSIMEITVIPDDPKANFSLYAYQDGTTSDAYPPNLNSCVSCEADHKWDRPRRGKTQDHTRSVKLNAINNPYRVVIAVVGADGLAEGGFTLQIKTE